MSGEVNLTRGFLFDENDTDEQITLALLNKLIGDLSARVAPGSISNRELADGTISADKLSAALTAQLGVADGSITTAKLVDDAVTGDKIADDSIGNNHMQDDAIGTAEIIDGSVTEEKLSSSFWGDIAIFAHVMPNSATESVSGGGTSTSTGWMDRPLNTQDTNNITGCSLDTSTGVITLAAGRYAIEADIPLNSGATNANGLVRLLNISDSTYVYSSEAYLTQDQQYLQVRCVINISEAKTFKFQSYMNQNVTDTAFGKPHPSTWHDGSSNQITNRYSQVIIRRLGAYIA